MKRLGFFISIGLLIICSTSVWGQGATQPTPTSRPPAIVYFQTEFFTLPTLNEAEVGDGTIPVTWQTINLSDTYHLDLSAFQYQAWVSLPEHDAVLPATGRWDVPLRHPVNFGPMVYRLAIVTIEDRIVDQQFLMVDYQQTGTPRIEVFTASRIFPAADTFDIEVAWQVDNRQPDTNLEFDQLLPDGSVVSAELPRDFLWVPSHSYGTARLRYTAEAEAFLRLRVVSIADDTTLAEAILTIPMPSPIAPTPRSSMTPIQLPSSPSPTPSPAPPTITPTPVLGADAPHIISFTGTVNSNPTWPYLWHNFTWQTENAERVSLESGSIRDGVFYSGGWYQSDILPPNGSGGFQPKIDNYAARLCVVEPVAEGVMVCAVCNPQMPETCH